VEDGFLAGFIAEYGPDYVGVGVDVDVSSGAQKQQPQGSLPKDPKTR